MHTNRNIGFSVDGDLLFTTNNEVFLKNVLETKSIVCVQKNGEKIIPNFDDFHNANKKGFSNKIGSITNKGATMADLKSLFEKDSEQYKELDARIRYIQLYQQMEIDSLKGIEVSEMPKYWYSKNEIGEKIESFDENGQKKISYSFSEDDKFNLSILAKEKPYFMIYIYEDLMRQYKNYIEKQETICVNTFLKPLNEILMSNNKTEEESKFVNEYYSHFPVSNHNGTMNRICRYVECELENIKIDNKKMVGFNISMLKTDKEYDSKLFAEIKNLYNEYNKKIQNKTKELKKESIRSHKDRKKEKCSFILELNDEFRKKCFDLCEDEEKLCNSVIDVCYTSNNSKNFAWDIFGNQIIENLLNNNDRKMFYIEKDEDGDIEYFGENFSIYSKEV